MSPLLVPHLPPLEVAPRVNAMCERVRNTSPDIDRVYITDLSDIRWLTSFSGSNATVVVHVHDEKIWFVTDSRYGEQASRELMRACCSSEIHVPASLSEHKELMQRIMGDCKVGVDGSGITAEAFRNVSQDFDVVMIDTHIADLRRVKDDAEIARIEHAALIADEALQHVVSEGLEGKTERQVKDELEFQMVVRGADGPSFDTIVAAGENAALPHHRASDKVIANHEAVIIDIGALVDGYHSDMTRTVRVGHLDRELSFMLSVTTAAQHEALSQLRAGVTTAEVDAAAREVFREVDVEGLFTHGLGHGVGLAIHENPFLSRRPGEALREGEVVTVEPGLYRMGVGGVRVEDLVVITHDGYRSLSRTRKDVSCPQSARMI